jgi:hypothetical protein
MNAVPTNLDFVRTAPVTMLSNAETIADLIVSGNPAQLQNGRDKIPRLRVLLGSAAQPAPPRARSLFMRTSYR